MNISEPEYSLEVGYGDADEEDMGFSKSDRDNESHDDPSGLGFHTKPPKYRILTTISTLCTIGFVVYFASSLFFTDGQEWTFSFLFLGVSDLLVVIAFMKLIRYYRTIGDAKTHAFLKASLIFFVVPLMISQVGLIFAFGFSDSCLAGRTVLDNSNIESTESFCQCDYNTVGYLLEHVTCYYNEGETTDSLSTSDLLSEHGGPIAHSTESPAFDFDSVGGDDVSNSIRLIREQALPFYSSLPFRGTRGEESEVCGERRVSSAELIHRVASSSTGCQMYDEDLITGQKVHVVLGGICTGDVLRLVAVLVISLFEFYLIAVVNLMSRNRMYQGQETLSLTGLEDSFEMVDIPEYPSGIKTPMGDLEPEDDETNEESRLENEEKLEEEEGFFSDLDYQRTQELVDNDGMDGEGETKVEISNIHGLTQDQQLDEAVPDEI